MSWFSRAKRRGEEKLFPCKPEKGWEVMHLRGAGGYLGLVEGVLQVPEISGRAFTLREEKKGILETDPRHLSRLLILLYIATAARKEVTDHDGVRREVLIRLSSLKNVDPFYNRAEETGKRRNKGAGWLTNQSARRCAVLIAAIAPEDLAKEPSAEAVNIAHQAPAVWRGVETTALDAAREVVELLLLASLKRGWKTMNGMPLFPLTYSEAKSFKTLLAGCVFGEPSVPSDLPKPTSILKRHRSLVWALLYDHPPQVYSQLSQLAFRRDRLPDIVPIRAGVFGYAEKDKVCAWLSSPEGRNISCVFGKQPRLKKRGT